MTDFRIETLTHPVCDQIFMGNEIKITCQGQHDGDEKSSFVKENTKFLKDIKKSIKGSVQKETKI